MWGLFGKQAKKHKRIQNPSNLKLHEGFNVVCVC